MKNNGFKGKYIGLDISPDMLKISKKLYPENVYLLGELKYERAKLNNVDYIVSSQTFNRNLKQSDNYYEVKEFIKQVASIKAHNWMHNSIEDKLKALRDLGKKSNLSDDIIDIAVEAVKTVGEQ